MFYFQDDLYQFGIKFTGFHFLNHYLDIQCYACIFLQRYIPSELLCRSWSIRFQCVVSQEVREDNVGDKIPSVINRRMISAIVLVFVVRFTF